MIELKFINGSNNLSMHDKARHWSGGDADLKGQNYDIKKSNYWKELDNQEQQYPITGVGAVDTLVPKWGH